MRNYFGILHFAEYKLMLPRCITELSEHSTHTAEQPLINPLGAINPAAEGGVPGITNSSLHLSTVMWGCEIPSTILIGYVGI